MTERLQERFVLPYMVMEALDSPERAAEKHAANLAYVVNEFMAQAGALLDEYERRLADIERRK